MSKDPQISAQVSPATRALLEKYSRATGVKKGHLVEQALLHHLRALQELPVDVILPAKLVVSHESGQRVLERLARPARPTRKLRDLMGGHGD